MVDHIDSSKVDELGKTVFVFPSRRACHYFREALLQKFPNSTFWLPGILSIEDFIVHCTGKSISSEIDLLFALYESYSKTYLPSPSGKVDKEELPTFDKFYAWGQVLLKDFDEVDRYLVDAGQLYQNLEQLSELESKFKDSEEVQDALKRFNKMMGMETALIANFANQWSRVSKTYHSYKKHLNGSHLYYSGMLYRDLAEALDAGRAHLPFERVVFGGFNALSKSEEVIMDALLKSGVGSVYWDADRMYMDNETEEAGKFMRRNYRKWPSSKQVHWVVTNMIDHPKRIEFIGGVQAIGQSQALGQKLAEIPASELEGCGIVLADEGLLFPVLYALPENIQSLNVTMGYPTKHSHWFHLANAYMEYQLHLRGKAENAYAEVSYARQLLANPLMKRVVTAKRLRIPAKHKSKWIPVRELLPSESPSVLQTAIIPKTRVIDLVDSLVELMMLIYQKLRLEQQLNELESELAFHSLKHLMQLEQQVKKHHRQLDPRTLARLMVQAFEQASIPFSGEPIRGLQLMGFLETRALDFEQVIILSANEGKLPRGNRHQSYIPYAIRKAFKLPTFEEQDAIYAYHFKRVLQRAKKVTIMYNTEVAIDGSGEKSRFIWQLRENFPEGTITENTFQMTPGKSPVSPAIEIRKTSEVLNMMQRFLIGEQRKPLSPTAIRHYLDCSLRFYFRYVIRLREREEESPELDARDFGNIVHQVFEILYQPFTGSTVTRDQIKQRLTSQAINDAVAESIGEYLNITGTPLAGRDDLHQQVIQKVVYKALERDLAVAPFSVVGTEMKLTTDHEFGEGKVVQLQGTLDRVHQAKDIIHIVDYKTGKADLKTTWAPVFPNGGTEYIKEHFDLPKYKSGFQSLFYGYLWNKSRGPASIKLGVYPLKKVNEGIQWLNHGQPIPPSGFEEFERMLNKKLQELFDPAVPFSQTEDAELCRFCAYREICQR